MPFSLRKFGLRNCTFDRIKISSSSLEFLEIKTECKTAELAALNLQSLVLRYCGQVDFLHVGQSEISGYLVFAVAQNQISNLSRLENLILVSSAKFERINISSFLFLCGYFKLHIRRLLSWITLTNNHHVFISAYLLRLIMLLLFRKIWGQLPIHYGLTLKHLKVAILRDLTRNSDISKGLAMAFTFARSKHYLLRKVVCFITILLFGSWLSLNRSYVCIKNQLAL